MSDVMDRIFEARMQRTNQCIEQLKKENERLEKEREQLEKDIEQRKKIIEQIEERKKIIEQIEQRKKEIERIEKDFADYVISNGRSQGFSLDKVIREVVENVHWEPDRAADYVSSRWAAT